MPATQGSTITLTDQSGRTIHLERRIGHGGEGEVFLVAGLPEVAAKIYYVQMANGREEKVKALISYPANKTRDFCAWPTALLYEGRQFRGFLMPLIKEHKELHFLYGPKSRKIEFPNADFRLLVRAAANIARAIASAHAEGIVVGDINERSVFVGRDSTVKLIDCDSFQVKTSTQLFPCDVGVSSFTSPELQGRNLRGVTRTTQHDAFSLAVLIFLLIFMGRHPFAGRYARGSIELEEAIKDCRYAYSADLARTGMSAPPNTLAIESGAGREIAEMFERSFSPSAIGGQSRPSADDWVKALEQLDKTLTSCNWNRAHVYARGQTSCPWCAFESRTGVDLFAFKPTDQAQASTVDVEAIFQALGALTIPSVPKAKPAPSLSTLNSRPLPSPLAEKVVRYKDVECESRRVCNVVYASGERAKAADCEVAKIHAALVDANPRLRRLSGMRDGTLQTDNRDIVLAAACALFGSGLTADALSALLGSKIVPGQAFVGLIFVVGFYYVLRREYRAWRSKRAGTRYMVTLEAAINAEPSVRGQIEAHTRAAAEAREEEERNTKLAKAIETGMNALREEIQSDVNKLRGELLQKVSDCSKELDRATAALGEVEALRAYREKDLRSQQEMAAKLVKQCQSVNDKRRADLQKLRDDERMQQFQAFLDRLFIDAANIQGITRSLKVALKSYGIETAADVTETKVSNVPGFGPVRTGRMIGWRWQCERSFTYIPGKALDPSKVAAIESKCLAERCGIERDLQILLDQTKGRVAQLSSKIGPAKLAADRAVDRLAQAEADLRVLAQVQV